MRNSASRRKSVGHVSRRPRRATPTRDPLPTALGFDRRGDEPGEQRMRARGPRLQLGMELAADEPRMIRQLDDLDELAVGREAAQLHAVLDEQLAVLVRDFITMAMALAHLRLAVDLGGARAARQPARIRAEAHRAAHVRHVLLRFHQRDDGIVALRRELRRVAVVEAADVARELDDRRLHAEANAEERQPRSRARGESLRPCPRRRARRIRRARAARRPCRESRSARSGHEKVFARHPLNVDADVVGDAAVNERFLHALVAVGVVRVLADDGDPHALVRHEHALHELSPRGERGRRGRSRPNFCSTFSSNPCSWKRSGIS